MREKQHSLPFFFAIPSVKAMCNVSFAEALFPSPDDSVATLTRPVEIIVQSAPITVAACLFLAVCLAPRRRASSIAWKRSNVLLGVAFGAVGHALLAARSAAVLNACDDRLDVAWRYVLPVAVTLLDLALLLLLAPRSICLSAVAFAVLGGLTVWADAWLRSIESPAAPLMVPVQTLYALQLVTLLPRLPGRRMRRFPGTSGIQSASSRDVTLSTIDALSTRLST